MIAVYIKLFRCKHYIKNLLILVPLVCSGQFFNYPSILVRLLFAFICFCCLASSIYITNDILDRPKDIKHPKKCHRPVAKGIIKVKTAAILAGMLLLFSLFLATWLSIQSSFAVISVLLVYYFFNIAYSIKLKHIPIIEVAILASGFLIRVLFGGFVTGIEVSSWLYLTILSISFYLGLGKRRNEMEQLSQNNTRKVLKHYNQRFLDRNMYMFLTLTLCFYSLWAMEQGNWALWSIIIVIIGCMRYSLIVEGTSDGDPTEVILKDKQLILIAMIYGLYMITTIYIL